MSQPSGDRVQDLFDQAVTLPAEQRGAFLEAACAGDAALRTEVESLLACDADFPEGAGDKDVLQSPVDRALASTWAVRSPGPGQWPPHPLPRVGHYRIL